MKKVTEASPETAILLWGHGASCLFFESRAGRCCPPQGWSLCHDSERAPWSFCFCVFRRAVIVLFTKSCGLTFHFCAAVWPACLQRMVFAHRSPGARIDLGLICVLFSTCARSSSRSYRTIPRACTASARSSTFIRSATREYSKSRYFVPSPSSVLDARIVVRTTSS